MRHLDCSLNAQGFYSRMEVPTPSGPEENPWPTLGFV
jgi:hypothetical protein